MVATRMLVKQPRSWVGRHIGHTWGVDMIVHGKEFLPSRTIPKLLLFLQSL
jgi:hypothetical protein